MKKYAKPIFIRWQEQKARMNREAEFQAYADWMKAIKMPKSKVKPRTPVNEMWEAFNAMPRKRMFTPSIPVVEPNPMIEAFSWMPRRSMAGLIVYAYRTIPKVEKVAKVAGAKA